MYIPSIREIKGEIKFAWLRATKGIDYKIRNGWGLDDYFYKLVPELKIFIERQIKYANEDKAYLEGNWRRFQIYRRTLRKIEDFEKMTDRDELKENNPATKLFEYIGKHYGWYWD